MPELLADSDTLIMPRPLTFHCSQQAKLNKGTVEYPSLPRHKTLATNITGLYLILSSFRYVIASLTFNILCIVIWP